jgi:hypothetical protein
MAFARPICTCKDPLTYGIRAVPTEVLIKARLPPDTTQHLSGCNYPTPSSNSYQAPIKSVKTNSTNRKKTYYTALGNSQAIKNAADNIINIPDSCH